MRDLLSWLLGDLSADIFQLSNFLGFAKLQRVILPKDKPHPGQLICKDKSMWGCGVWLPYQNWRQCQKPSQFTKPQWESKLGCGMIFPLILLFLCFLIEAFSSTRWNTLSVSIGPKELPEQKSCTLISISVSFLRSQRINSDKVFCLTNTCINVFYISYFKANIIDVPIYTILLIQDCHQHRHFLK